MVFNELEGCKIDIPQLPRGDFFEVYAVDGGSADGTREYLESQGIPVYIQPVKSLNAAYHYAVEKSTGDAVVVFFPKGTIHPHDAAKAIPYLQQGIDLVVASRNIEHGHNEEDGKLIKPRKWSVLALSTLASIIWRREGYRIKDVLHGFKGFSKAGFHAMAVSPRGVSIDIEMVVRSYRLGLSRTEFPTVESARSFGITHFPIFKTGGELLKYLFRELSLSKKMLRVVVSDKTHCSSMKYDVTRLNSMSTDDINTPKSASVAP